ncbi:IS91 family transposase [uncultured Marivirga sp.]|uniref:IS91 family transposase n=1 Tax=uncultured Marivirga sp. TaxID=1123707 RepID=UPI0030EDFD01
MENKRQKTELADIFIEHAADYLNTTKLCLVQKKAYQAITQCRSASMGGHINSCDNCGYNQQAYNSCRNRHCPKCQFIRKAKWVDKLASNLPATKYFHLVFTVPHCLNKLFYINQKLAYGVLFKAAGQSLMQCAKNPKYLGAKAGAVSILHTWGQNLDYHPHIHMIVPAGGLTEDGREWIPSSPNYFLPVKVLSAVFRGILLKLLEASFKNDRLKIPAGTHFEQLKQQCYKTKWVVYSEKPFKCPENLINYLGNYTHRVAISNQRIMSHQNGKVSFNYKDYRCGGLRKVMSLEAGEFIRRFMQHVLPEGFCKIRYFGFMSLSNLKQARDDCNHIINKITYFPVLEGLNGMEVYRQLTGKDPVECSKCKAKSMKAVPLPKQKTPG